MSYLKSFTKVLENFINELSEVHPDDNHVEMAKKTIYLLKKTNLRNYWIFMNIYVPYELK